MKKIYRETNSNNLKYLKIPNVTILKYKLSRHQKIIQLKCYLKYLTTFKQM